MPDRAILRETYPSQARTANPLNNVGNSACKNSSENTWADSLLTPGPVAVLVLGILCCVVGCIYAYIYFTRINPRLKRRSKFLEQRAKEEESATQPVATHMFLFRKSLTKEF